MNSQGTGGRGRGQAPLAPIFRGIAAGIGFASESIQHRKEKKRAAKLAEGDGASAATQPPKEGGQPNTDVDEAEAAAIISQQLDEATWALDDAQGEVVAEINLDAAAPESATETPAKESDTADKKEMHSKKLADGFIARHPVPSNAIPRNPLALPVILTQRRPKTRVRGFIRAYAPVLEAAGIDQTTFLDFIVRLNKAVEPNPWIQAINLASFAAQNIPEPFTLLIGIAVSLVANAASEMHSRGKTNIFLDRLNEQYFKPRGLVALLMTWKPETASRLTDVYMDNGVAGMERDISSAAAGPSGKLSKITNRLKASSAESSFEWPDTAPLVFPALDELADSNPVGSVDGGGDKVTQKKKENALKRGGKFVDSYLDRRAQAKWSGENPDSKMANAMPKPTFKSRYADPNHAASSGDVIALLTGGHLQAPTLPGRGGGGGFGGFGGGLRGRDSDAAQRGGLGGILGGMGSGSRLGGGRGGRSQGEYDDNGRGGGMGLGRGRGLGGNREVGGFSGGRGLGGGPGTGGEGIPGPLSLVSGFKKILQQVSFTDPHPWTLTRDV